MARKSVWEWRWKASKPLPGASLSLNAHCRVEGGRLAFTCAVKGPNGARMLYEVVADAD